MRVDPTYIQNLAGPINAGSVREQQLTSQLSSGLRVNQLADDPLAVSANVGLASSISGIDSFVHGASTKTSLLQVTDSTLGEVVSQVTSAISLAVSAGTSTLNAANRSVIAQQVSGIRDNVLALANTSYLGTYVFSGSKGDTKPFALDTTTTPATATYSGDTITQTIETPGGGKIQTNLPGSQIFQSTGNDLLGALNTLANDLASGTTTQIQADSSQLSAALSYVSAQRATLDTSLSQLTATSTYAQTQGAELRVEQSTLLSADPATIATDLKSAEVQRQALLSVVATISQTNLFNYVK